MKPTCVASHHLDTCSWEVWQKSIQGKWQKWCMVHSRHKTTPLRPIFRAIPETFKPIARFRWKRARLSFFRPQPYLPSFIQIHPSFRDFLVKTTFQIVTIISDPIRPSDLRAIRSDHRISDKNGMYHTKITYRQPRPLV